MAVASSTISSSLFLLHTTHHTSHITHYPSHTTHHTLHTTHHTPHTTHYTPHTTMTTALINTVRMAVALVQPNDDCPVWLAAIQLLKDYLDNLPDTPLHIVTGSVLCFKNANDRRQYTRSQGDLPATSVWTVMKPALQHRIANIPRLFLYASQYRTTGIANAADQ